MSLPLLLTALFAAGQPSIAPAGDLTATSTSSPPTGELLVICSARGAQVRVDGRPVGRTPLPVLRLAAGRHHVQVEAPGSEPFGATIEVRAGTFSRVEVRLAPQVIYAPLAIGEPGIETSRTGHTPIITRWWFWGVVAVLGAAIVVTGLHFSTNNDFVPTGELGSSDTSDWTRF